MKYYNHLSPTTWYLLGHIVQKGQYLLLYLDSFIRQRAANFVVNWVCQRFGQGPVSKQAHKMCFYRRWEETRQACIASVSSPIINFNHIIWIKKWHLFPGQISWNLSNFPILEETWLKHEQIIKNGCTCDCTYSYKRWHLQTGFLNNISRKENVYGSGPQLSLVQLECCVMKSEESELLADLAGRGMDLRSSQARVSSFADSCDWLLGRIIPPDPSPSLLGISTAGIVSQGSIDYPQNLLLLLTIMGGKIVPLNYSEWKYTQKKSIRHIWY